MYPDPTPSAHRPRRRLAAAQPGGLPLHRPLVAIDIVGFGRTPARHHQHLRDQLYRIVKAACAAALIRWQDCHHEGRGDGLIIIPPPTVSAHLLLDPVAARLRAGIRRHNETASADAQLRVRVAMHAGYVALDRNGGANGRDLVHMARLLECPSLKDLVDSHSAEVALVVSHYLYSEIIQHPHGLIDPAAFQLIPVHCKETHTLAWAQIAPRRSAPITNGADAYTWVTELCEAGWTARQIADALNP